MLSRLRFLKREDYLQLPDSGDGLAERLYEAVQREKDYSSVIQSASTKRYPQARVRRMALHAALGVTVAAAQAEPEYIRVLAFNDRGRKLLHKASRDSALPVLTKAAQVHRLPETAEKCFSLGASAHDFYTLLYPAHEIQACGEDWRRGPVICTDGS